MWEESEFDSYIKVLTVTNSQIKLCQKKKWAWRKKEVKEKIYTWNKVKWNGSNYNKKTLDFEKQEAQVAPKSIPEKALKEIHDKTSSIFAKHYIVFTYFIMSIEVTHTKSQS